MYFSGKRLERMIYILDVFAGDLEVRLCKNCTVIFSFSRSIKRCSFTVSARSQKFDPVDMLKIKSNFYLNKAIKTLSKRIFAIATKNIVKT
jgi:hypothetical protein